MPEPEPEPELAPEPELDTQAIYYEAEQEAEEQPTPTVEGIAQMEPEEPGLDPAFAAESLDESYFELETVAERGRIGNFPFGSRHCSLVALDQHGLENGSARPEGGDGSAAVLLAVALSPTVPKVRVTIPNLPKGDVQQVQKAVTERWKSLNQTISNRAAIAYADDFRAGLDAWRNRSSLTTSCSL